MEANDKKPNIAEDASSFKAILNQKLSRKTRDFSILDQDTVRYLQKDRQNLQKALVQAMQSDQGKLVSKLGQRITKYYLVEDFFFWLAQGEKPTQIQKITTQDIVNFVDRDRPLTIYKGKSTLESLTGYKYARRNDKTELNEFFARATQAGIIPLNPAAPLAKVADKLAPKHPSTQTLSDLEAFESYLNTLVNSNQLSLRTSHYLRQTLTLLLHDAEVQHDNDPTWPSDLDGLFSHPRWVYDWLTQSNNRSRNASSEQLARGTNLRRLGSIRHIFNFLKQEGRISSTYFRDLKEMFEVEDGTNFIPGRSAKRRGALSEVEEERLFAAIAQGSQKPELLLRDKAIIITAITTTIHIDGLSSMRIENFKEIKPGIWTCYVIVKRSSRKDSESNRRPAKDKSAWQGWYISPRARAAIEEYLITTDRNWQSTGPVWLTYQHSPLSDQQLRDIIRKWLVVANCSHTNPQVLRHTGIDRLINKNSLPISLVQMISQHTDLSSLIKIYVRRPHTDAYQIVNQIFPAAYQKDENDFKDPIVAININLQKLSETINQRTQEGLMFGRQQAEEFLEVLRNQIEILSKALEKE